MAGEGACVRARDEIKGLSTPDSPEVFIYKRFFPRDKLAVLLTKTKVTSILRCKCERCTSDTRFLGGIGRPHDYVDQIVGEGSDPSRTAISLFALLIYVGHPLFIANFMRKNINDNTLETSHSEFQSPALEDTYWKAYRRHDSQASTALATEFRGYRRQFAIPHIGNSPYSVYQQDTILPFIDEERLGIVLEDGQIQDEGSYGTVYSFKIWPAYNKLTSAGTVQRFARKELKGRSPVQFNLEMNNLTTVNKLNDPHIVKIIKAYKNGTTFNIIFPCAKTNLGRFLRDQQYNAEEMNRTLPQLNPLWTQMLGVARALDKIITYDVPDVEAEERMFGYHFDLKPQNILVEDNNTLVISDFGQAYFKKVTGTSSRVVGKGGTDAYAPPEMENLNNRPNRKYDVWSLGCILVEVATFVAHGSEGLRRLDDLRITQVDSREVDDRFFEQIPGTEGYRLKEDVSDWIKDIPVAERVTEERSRQFLNLIIELSKDMLAVELEKRIPSSEVHRRLQDILSRFQTSEIGVAPARARSFKPEDGESTLGRRELSKLQTLWFWRHGWERADIHAFEDLQNPGSCRLFITGQGLNGFENNERGFRPHLYLIPSYLYVEPHGHQQSHWFSFSSLDPTGVHAFRGVKFLFSASEEAHNLQSVLTGQVVQKSFKIESASYDVRPSLRKAISRWTLTGKNEPKKSDAAVAVQLWSERDYIDKPLAPLESPTRTHAVFRLVRDPVEVVETTPRRIALFYKDRIISIPLAKNMRIDPNSTSPHTLRLSVTDRSKDKYFFASAIYPTQSEKANNHPFPGIPLCKKTLRQIEDENMFECSAVIIKFKSADDLTSFQNKYLVLKENWRKENKDIEGRNRQLTR